MKQQLKSVFRSASKKKNKADDPNDPSSPSYDAARAGRQMTSLDEQRRRQSGDARRGGAHYDDRSRPLSSSGPGANDRSGSNYSGLKNEPIAKDYRAYMSGLSHDEDTNQEASMSLGGDRRLISEEREGRHEEGVADRNIDRSRTSGDGSTRKPLLGPPAHDVANDTGSFSSKPSLDTSDTTKYSLGGRTRRPRGSESEDDGPRTPPDNLRHDVSLPSRPKAKYDGQHDIGKKMEQLLDGVVDLRDTVEEDKDVTYAPAVMHEVVKPHTHEIVQQKIFREIHNYEHYHRIQPVYHLEVLPPRHWIPDPKGDGLIEVSADELPSRTGDNRRWKIVVEEPEPSTQARAQAPTPWHTEPKIIEHPTTIDADGFERKETTIIHPPTLRDLTDYGGLVQPIHFDHKTGKRWLGPLSTMQQLRQELDRVDNVPKTPGATEVPGLSQSPESKRRSKYREGRQDGNIVAA